MNDLTGRPIIVLDLETLRLSQDCFYCGDPPEVCNQRGYASQALGHTFEAIGWNRHTALGISIGCYYSYLDSRIHWFDQHTLHTTMWTLIEQRPLIVSFNGRGFDGPLMLACVDDPVTPAGEPASDLPGLWQALWDASYDILAEIWRVDPERKFERGLNSLDAISQANGLGAKEMHGAVAPQLWRQGRWAEVIAYNVSDVLKTKRLFEQIVDQGTILRGDRRPLALPRPILPLAHQEAPCDK